MKNDFVSNLDKSSVFIIDRNEIVADLIKNVNTLLIEVRWN